MSTGNKIFISIMVVLILALIIGLTVNKTINETEQNTLNSVNTSSSVFEVYDGAIENDTEIEENKAIEETNEDVINSNYVGVEENTSEVSNNVEEQVINKVKEAYGTTDGVYFSIKRQEGNIYHIAVTEENDKNGTVIAWYTVNADNWHVFEN